MRSLRSNKNAKKQDNRSIPKWRKDPRSIEKYNFLYHFVPHPHKKKRAKLLSLKFFGMYSLVVLCSLLVLTITPNFMPGVLGYASDINITTLLNETNNARSENGLKPLVINKPLSQAAYNKAQDMFKQDYWAHISPTGTEPWDFILKQDYDYIYAGENLAKNFSKSDDVVQAWLESPSHRDNILNSNYQEVGFAVVNGILNGYETTLVVQMFGQPRDQSTIASASEYDSIIASIQNEQGYKNQLSATTSANPQNNTNNNSTPLTILNVDQQNLSEQNQNPSVQNQNNPIIPINTVTSYLVVLLIGFIIGLLVIDIAYSHKNNVHKISGHTTAHLIFLAITIVSVWLAFDTGFIL